MKDHLSDPAIIRVGYVKVAIGIYSQSVSEIQLCGSCGTAIPRETRRAISGYRGDVTLDIYLPDAGISEISHVEIALPIGDDIGRTIKSWGLAGNPIDVTGI